VKAGKETNLPHQLHALAERLPRRSLVILVSDLWVDPGELVRALQHLRYRKHQAMVLHLLDRAEIDLPYEKQITLEDLETGEKLQINAGDLREAYQQQVQEYLGEVRRACTGGDSEYHTIFTDRGGETGDVVCIPSRSIRIQSGGQRQVVLLNIRLHHVQRFARIDRNNFQPLIRQRLIRAELCQVRQRLPARRTPCRPEIHNHHFTLQIRQLDFLAIGCFQRQVRRGFAIARICIGFHLSAGTQNQQR
jgi:hypothetical protein